MRPARQMHIAAATMKVDERWEAGVKCGLAEHDLDDFDALNAMLTHLDAALKQFC